MFCTCCNLSKIELMNYYIFISIINETQYANYTFDEKSA